MKSKLAVVMIAAGALAGLAGISRAERVDRGVAVPVLTASRVVGAELSVCMHPGAMPQAYRVKSVSCRVGDQGEG